jgi:hypothetical protein
VGYVPKRYLAVIAAGFQSVGGAVIREKYDRIGAEFRAKVPAART